MAMEYQWGPPKNLTKIVCPSPLMALPSQKREGVAILSKASVKSMASPLGHCASDHLLTIPPPHHTSTSSPVEESSGFSATDLLLDHPSYRCVSDRCVKRSEIQELQQEDTLPFAPDTIEEGREEDSGRVCGSCYQTDTRTGEVGNLRDLRCRRGATPSLPLVPALEHVTTTSN